MKKRSRQQEHATDLLFILSLFCVFAASAVLVITFGANVYQSTVERMEDNYTARVSLSYIANQVRQHDQQESIMLTSWEGTEALVLADGPDSGYATFIYYYDGALRELYCDRYEPLGAADGLAIIELADCQMTLQDELLQIQTVDTSGKSSSLTLALRAQSDGGDDR